VFTASSQRVFELQRRPMIWPDLLCVPSSNHALGL
jgi:hypothetical protein